MELSDLLTFSAVARLGGITRAADELNTVQSNVTQRVKALEAEIGTALFERHSRGMTLTGAGRRLLPYAQRMAALSREAMLAARDDGEPKGPLSIGSMETTAAVRLPSLLAEFHRRFPAVKLSLRTSTTADLVAGVLDGSLDGAFVAGPIEHAELEARTAFREELVLVSSRRWSTLKALRAGTAKSGPTALVFRTGCTYRQRLEQVFTEFGWPSAARFELGTLDGMIGCVAADMGVTMLPRAVVGRNRDRYRPHAEPGSIAGRDPLHHPPRRPPVQRASGFCRLPGKVRRRHRRLMNRHTSFPALLFHSLALSKSWRRMVSGAMPALILPLIEAASHWPERGALVGLDLGTKTIGVAVSNPDRRLATGVETIQRKAFKADAARLLAIAAERNAVGFVLGLPINMDGSEGPRAQSTRAFARNFSNSPTWRWRCGTSGSRRWRSSAN